MNWHRFTVSAGQHELPLWKCSNKKHIQDGERHKFFVLVAKPENSFLKKNFHLVFYTKSNSMQQNRTQMNTNVKQELGRRSFYILTAPADPLKEPQYSH